MHAPAPTSRAADDTSPDAEYDAWMIVEPEGAGAGDPGETPGTDDVVM